MFEGLCLLAVLYENEATVAISVPAVGLALTATQVTNLALIKLIGVQTGLILGRLSRNKRQVFDDEALNTVSQSQTVGDLATLLAKHELQQCTQLLFCAAASHNSEIVLDKVEMKYFFKKLFTRVGLDFVTILNRILKLNFCVGGLVVA